MNQYNRLLVDAALCCGVLLTALGDSHAQTLINLGTQSRNIDFSSAQTTRPVKAGSTLPTTCSTGEFFFNTSAAAGQNLFSCVSNSWTSVGQTTGLSDPGSNGIVKRTASNTTVALPTPLGTIVGTSDAQTLTNKSIDASEINSGTFSAARMPALTGDVTANTGSTVTALSTVNSTPGSFGDATHSVQLTVDAKGRVTGVSQIAITGTGGTAAGALASIPATCSSGALYLATDQPISQQLYTCSSANIWTPYMSLGGSGALAVTNGALDVVTNVVPRLAAANTFTGLNTFASGVRMGGGTQPSA